MIDNTMAIEKGQKDIKWIRSTTQKTKYWATKTRDENRFSGKVSRSCSTSDTSFVILVKKPAIRHKWRKDLAVIQTVCFIMSHTMGATSGTGIAYTRRVQPDV